MYIYCLFVDMSVSLSVGLYIGLSVFIILSNVCDVLFLMECFSLPASTHTYTLVFMCVSICACVYGGAALSLPSA